jgi:hypothetical protein
MVKVLHYAPADRRSFIRVFDDEMDEAVQAWASTPHDWMHVADVETDDLDHAFERTNTIDRLWALNEDVRVVHVKTKYRSTSIGDVLITADGKRHMVATFGFKEF